MKKRIIVYGDSNTWGYISGSDNERYPDDMRWTGRLAEYLGSDYTVIEEGYIGRTTVWYDPVEDRMSGINYLVPCMESHAPFDLIAIMLGTNDLKTYFSNSATDIAVSIERLIKIVKDSWYGREHKAPKIMILSPIHIKANRDEPLFGMRAEKKSFELAVEYEKAAKRQEVMFLDAALYAEPDSQDGIHMAPEYFPILAKAVANKIRDIL